MPQPTPAAIAADLQDLLSQSAPLLRERITRDPVNAHRARAFVIGLIAGLTVGFPHLSKDERTAIGEAALETAYAARLL